MKIDAHTLNLLLTLAHLGMADVDQLRRLHFPALAQGTVQNRLTAISDIGLIEQRPWAIGGVRQRSMWVLTVKGQRQVASDPAYPGKPIARSDKLFNHDRRCIDVIVRCIELARQTGLAGAQVVREVRLDRRRARPKADALLFLETRRGAESVDTVPWAMGLPLKEEQPWRVAIEAETGSQAVKIAAEKATAYREVYENAAWRAQWTAHYGPPPIVYLVCASTERAAQIATAWRERWPGGHWAITGDEGLAANRWHYHHGGQSRPRTALRFRSREEIAEDKQTAAKRQEQAKAAAEQAWRDRQAAELAALDAQPARPLAELIKLHKWRPNQTTTFRPDGGLDFLWAGSLRQTHIRFSTAEQASWREYEEFKLEQAAELERSIAAAREERERGLAAEQERKAAVQRRRAWWAARWDDVQLLGMVVIVGVLAILLIYVVKYEIIPTAHGLFNS